MRILVCGAGGFIGHHLVRRLKKDGHWVRGCDLKFPRFSGSDADDFMIGDLRDPYFVRHMVDQRFDEIYQLAADMGGAGYIFTGYCAGIFWSTEDESSERDGALSHVADAIA
jgi:GDP-D-mannose 3',5'-epimerase